MSKKTYIKIKFTKKRKATVTMKNVNRRNLKDAKKILNWHLENVDELKK
jgi:hypothetical protein